MPMPAPGAARPRQRALPCVISRTAHAGGRPRRFAQLFNVNGDSAAALDVSVHYPMLQLIVFFDWVKPEDVANGTARARALRGPRRRASHLPEHACQAPGGEGGGGGRGGRLWPCVGKCSRRQLGLQGVHGRVWEPSLGAPCHARVVPRCLTAS